MEMDVQSGKIFEFYDYVFKLYQFKHFKEIWLENNHLNNNMLFFVNDIFLLVSESPPKQKDDSFTIA